MFGVDGLNQVIGYLRTNGLVHDVLLLIFRHHHHGHRGHDMLRMQKEEANHSFARFISRNYEHWVNHPDDRPTMSPDVMKRCGGEENGTLKVLVKRRGSRANQKELETLEQQAALGKRYLSELRGEVKRLVLVCEQEADGAAIEKMAAKLDEEELREMERLYRVKAAKKLGLRTQLTYGEKMKAAEDENDFRV